MPVRSSTVYIGWSNLSPHAASPPSTSVATSDGIMRRIIAPGVESQRKKGTAAMNSETTIATGI